MELGGSKKARKKAGGDLEPDLSRLALPLPDASESFGPSSVE